MASEEDRTSRTPSQHTTFALEHPMRLGINHLENLVDATGQTYFDVFMTDPAEAVHDWPDFVDLPSRYLEAAIMVRQMLGIKIKTEDVLRRRVLSTLHQDGLAHRPETPYTREGVYTGEQGLVLKALNTLYMDRRDPRIAKRMRAMVDGLGRVTMKRSQLYFAIRPLVQSWRTIGYGPALDLAEQLASELMYRTSQYGVDGSYSGHHHSHLETLAGVLSYALVVGKTDLVARVKKCFDFAVSISTRFGFVPEVAERKADIVGCETCAIMDYLDVAILLARNGYPQYWDVVEKTARNHLVESQIRDGSWLGDAPSQGDTDRIVYTGVPSRAVGAFAGWSSPDHYLAFEDELWTSWCKDESQYPFYLGKIRALQNCCAGSGLRAIFQVWKNIACLQGEDLYVNLHIDKKIHGVTVVGYQPYEGRTSVKVGLACRLHVRIPSFVTTSDVSIAVNGSAVRFEVEGPYAVLGRVEAGVSVEMTYPLPVWEEDIVIGNPGYKSFKYRIRWKGDTVIQVTPDSNNAKTGYSDMIGRDVRLHYAGQGPGKLYDRAHLLRRHLAVRASDARLDTSTVDWYDLYHQR